MYLHDLYIYVVMFFKLTRAGNFGLDSELARSKIAERVDDGFRWKTQLSVFEKHNKINA